MVEITAFRLESKPCKRFFLNKFSTNERTRIITGHVISNPAYTYKFQLKTTYTVFSLKHEIDLPAPQFWPCRPMCWSIHISIPLTLAWLLIIFQQLHNRVKIIMQSKSGTTYFFFSIKNSRQTTWRIPWDGHLTLWGRMQTAQASEQLLFSVQFKQSLCSPWWVVL